MATIEHVGEDVFYEANQGNPVADNGIVSPCESADTKTHNEPSHTSGSEPTFSSGVAKDNKDTARERGEEGTQGEAPSNNGPETPVTPAQDGDNTNTSEASPLERFSQAFSLLTQKAHETSSGSTTAHPLTFLTAPADPRLSPSDLKTRRFSPAGRQSAVKEPFVTVSAEARTEAEGIPGDTHGSETAGKDSENEETNGSESLPALRITEDSNDASDSSAESKRIGDRENKPESGQTVSGNQTNEEHLSNGVQLKENPTPTNPEESFHVPGLSTPPAAAEGRWYTKKQLRPIFGMFSQSQRTDNLAGGKARNGLLDPNQPTNQPSVNATPRTRSSLNRKAETGTEPDKPLNGSVPVDDNTARASSSSLPKSSSSTASSATGRENTGSLKNKTNMDESSTTAELQDQSSEKPRETGPWSSEKPSDDKDGEDRGQSEDRSDEEDDGQSSCDEDQSPEDKALATFFVGNDSNLASRQNSYPDDHTLLTKHENGNANGNDDHGDEPVTMRHGRKNQTSLLLGSLFMILSGLYGILIVVLGAVIPLTEIFVTEEGTAFEAFYIYLYSVSIIFLCYVYIYLLRRNRLRTEFLTRTLSRSISFTRGWASSWARAGSDRSRTRKRMVSLDESNHHTGTFYLRLGVLGFGIGSMIHSGLNFGKFFGSITEGQCSSGVALLVKPLLHLIFTFSQLYFIFMNSKMCIHRKKVLARFGLMHMAATNICVWFRSIVVETLHEIHHHHHAHHHDDHHVAGHDTDHVTDHVLSHGAHDAAGYQQTSHEPGVPENLTVSVGRKLLAASSHGNGSGGHATGGLLELKCSWDNMMGKAVDSAGPYLYPCTIEYSLMCAGILYVMWSNVGMRPRFRTNSEIEDAEQDLKQQRMSVDCTSSSRGLFLGIFLTVCAIISIIAFYVMVGQPHLRSEALLLTHLSETLIYCVTTLALVMATIKMRHLLFHSDHKSDLEETLIIIAYTGLLAFNIFSLIAAILMAPAEGAALTIMSNFTMMLQSAFQTIFMLAGDRMSARSSVQERKKPGREYVTFLLLCNFAMWIINTFETQKPEHNPLQVAFYGPEAWSIFSHISVPLGIYYRFHSTVCISNIWKNAWKMRKHH
ncbi:uncharacterized protein LOC143276782 isoform X2 [Babylonia areolata]|uniref:uncharacterized protein LOC143276782 isoform X2 n=1 Tax=Babylonia areolata TaxID=304850 RepID=UPI003FD5AA55